MKCKVRDSHFTPPLFRPLQKYHLEETVLNNCRRICHVLASGFSTVPERSNRLPGQFCALCLTEGGIFEPEEQIKNLAEEGGKGLARR